VTLNGIVLMIIHSSNHNGLLIDTKETVIYLDGSEAKTAAFGLDQGVIPRVVQGYDEGVHIWSLRRPKVR
jgi:hypothetical protein